MALNSYSQILSRDYETAPRHESMHRSSDYDSWDCDHYDRKSYHYISRILDNSVGKDFDNPAKIFGEGKYFVGDYATVSLRANSGFEFVGWQQKGNVVSKDKTYTFRVEKDSNIKAIFIKTIKIKQIHAKIGLQSCKLTETAALTNSSVCTYKQSIF